jgi:hypothetical protein
MVDDGRIAALMAPGETIIWRGRAGVWRSLSLAQVFWAVIGLGLVGYGAHVLWGYYNLRGAMADSVFRDVLRAPGKVHIQAGAALLLGMLGLLGFAAALLRARGTRFFLTQAQALVQTRMLFAETAMAGRIQVQGQVVTGRNSFGAVVVIPTGAGPDQDSFIAFTGLRDTEVAEVLAHIGRMAEGALDGR